MGNPFLAGSEDDRRRRRDAPVLSDFWSSVWIRAVIGSIAAIAFLCLLGLAVSVALGGGIGFPPVRLLVVAVQAGAIVGAIVGAICHVTRQSRFWSSVWKGTVLGALTVAVIGCVTAFNSMYHDLNSLAESGVPLLVDVRLNLVLAAMTGAMGGAILGAILGAIVGGIAGFVRAGGEAVVEQGEFALRCHSCKQELLIPMSSAGGLLKCPHCKKQTHAETFLKHVLPAPVNQR